MSIESQIEKFRRISGEMLDPEGDIITFCKEFKNILIRFKKRLPRTIETKRELYEPFFHALGIKKDSKNYDIDFLMEKCNEYINRKQPQEVKKDIQELKTTIELTIEIQNRNKENDTVSSIIYDTEKSRLFTIVKIPTNMFNGSTWKYDGSSYIFKRPECKNCGFYLSSGTSNEINFQNIWFPFLRIQEIEKGVEYSTQDKGWIHKSTMLYNSIRFKRSFYDLFKQKYNEEKAEVEYKNTFKSFFEKFSHWWQVSISASLDTNTDNLWNHDPFLLKVKILALEYDFDLNPSDDRTYFIKNNKITRYRIVKPLHTYSNPDDVNKWLSVNDALCLSKD